MSQCFDIRDALLYISQEKVRDVALGELCQVGGYSQITKEEMKHLNTGIGEIRLLPSSRNFDWCCSYEDAKQYAEYIYEDSVITVGNITPNIKMTIDEPFISSNNIIIKVIDNTLLQPYLYHLICENVSHFYKEGTTYNTASADAIRKYKVQIPPINVQRWVCYCLDKMVGIEYALKEEIRLSKDLSKAVSQKLFSKLKEAGG